MSFLDEGGTIHLVALSKPDFVIKLDAYEAKGYRMVPESHCTTGYAHKWQMRKVEEISFEDLGSGAAQPSRVSNENTIDSEEDEPTIAEPVTAVLSTAPVQKDFLPDWEKVDNFLKDNSEKEAKKLLDAYAEEFDVKLTRRSSFENMKKAFIKECSK